MHRILYICLALVLLTAGVFWPVRNHEFVNYDDPDYVTANPIVQKGLTREGVAWAFQNIHGEKTYWHPLTWLTHMADCQWFGLNPRGHHLGNVFLHTCNVVLLFLILIQMTGAAWRSALVAALFAVHPLQMDTVAWVTERKNVLSAFFMLFSLLAYVRYTKSRGPILYSLVIVFFAMALMSKPAVVTFPCLLLLLDVWPLRRMELAMFGHSEPIGATAAQPARTNLSPGFMLLEKVPLFLLSAASCKLTLMAHEGLGMLGGEHHWPLRLRLENAIVSYARFLKKILWPGDLAVLYPHPGKWPFLEVVLSGMVLLFICVLVVRAARQWPCLFTGWFWFLGMLVPAIGVVQVGFQSMADRFVYLPLIGVFIMVIWGFGELGLALPAPTRRLLAIGAGLMVAAYAGVTVLQLKHWRNSIALWEHTLRVTRNNYMAHHDLGVALRETNRLSEARTHFESTLSLRDNPATRLELARVFELQHATNDAIAQLEKAVLLAPRWPDARERLGYLLVQSSRKEEALAQYSELLRIAPGRADLHVTMAALLSGIHRVSEASAHYREALRLDPNDVVALNNLAWLLATNPDDKVRNGYEAASHAERACALTRWSNPGFLATYAAAQAECGRFEQAVEIISRAQAIATAAGETRTAKDCEKLRVLFSSRTAFREVDKH